MEFKVRAPNYLDRIHLAIMGRDLKGSYVRKNADAVIDEGSLIENGPGWVLESKDGKQQKFEAAEQGSIKDEGGTTWNLDNPQQHARLLKTLREW